MILFKPIKSVTESELKQFNEISESYNLEFNTNDDMIMAFEKTANNLIVGFIGFTTNTEYSYIKCFCVRKSSLKKGIGGGLLRIAKVISKKTLCVCVSSNDTVVGYLQKQGFCINDSPQNEDTTLEDDKVIMIRRM